MDNFWNFCFLLALIIKSINSSLTQVIDIVTSKLEHLKIALVFRKNSLRDVFLVHGYKQLLLPRKEKWENGKR